jgi:hypothetical protein
MLVFYVEGRDQAIILITSLINSHQVFKIIFMFSTIAVVNSIKNYTNKKPNNNNQPTKAKKL